MTVTPASKKNTSASQRRVIDHPAVTHVGWDARGRPVVEKRATWGPNIERWAVKRDGDPTEIREPVTPSLDKGEPT